MRGDFLPFAVEGGAQQEAFVRAELSREDFVEEREHLVPVKNFGVEAQRPKIHSKDVEVFTQREVSNQFEQSSVSTQAEHQMGVLEDGGTCFFVFLSQDLGQMAVPHQNQVFAFLKILFQLFEKGGVVLHVAATNETDGLEM